jgi:hypothetical protein
MGESMTEAQREIALKIRALLSKTVDKGCTEAEAMMAAAKAKELIDRYQIDMSEADIAEEGYVKGTAESDMGRKFNVQNWLAGSIARYCETKYWMTHNHGGHRRKTRIVFFGLKSDVEFANWLLTGLEAFVWTKADEFGGDYYEKRNFAMGCCNRIAERLREAIKEREARNVTMSQTGKSLVVVKGQLVESEFKKLGLRLRNSGGSSYRSGGSASSRAAGYAAGNGASFGRPVGRTSTARIGSR